MFLRESAGFRNSGNSNKSKIFKLNCSSDGILIWPSKYSDVSTESQELYISTTHIKIVIDEQQENLKLKAEIKVSWWPHFTFFHNIILAIPYF